MAMGMDMLAIISICPPECRPRQADNIIQVGTDLWSLWEYVDELLLNAEIDDDGIPSFNESDIWLLTWEVYWDVDEVVESFGAGYEDETGKEVIVDYTVWDVLENAQEMIGQDTQWLGEPDPQLRDQQNVNDMALHVTSMITGLPIVQMNVDVFNPELTSFVKWRSRLYGGVWRKEA